MELPSEVRQKVLAQHREIEALLAELSAGAKTMAQGEHAVAKVKRAANALFTVLELHMVFEEQNLLPEIESADGFGPERAKHMLDEHREQRAFFGSLRASIESSEDPDVIAARIDEFAAELRADIEQEEKDYLSPSLLKDDVVTSDYFGG